MNLWATLFKILLVFSFNVVLGSLRGERRSGVASTLNYTTGTSDWMSVLNDATLLQDIILPGSHDSCAIRGDFEAETQWSGVDEQLARGIRYFDMRVGTCAGAPSSFCLYHGPIYLGMNLDEPVWQMYNFLHDHPQEIIIMRLKHEHDGGDYLPDNMFQQFMEQNYINGHFEWLPHGSTSLNDLTLQQARHSIILLWDSGDKTSNFGYDYNSVNTRVNFEFNDVSEIVSTFLERAASSLSNAGWYENPTSGTIWIVSGILPVAPIVVAEGVNPQVQGYLNTNPQMKGIISMDVPSDDMINKMIELNAPFRA